MPAHKEEEIMELRRAFYMGGLLRMMDRCAVELHARNSSGVGLSLWWVIVKLPSSWVLPWTSPLWRLCERGLSFGTAEFRPC